MKGLLNNFRVGIPVSRSLTEDQIIGQSGFRLVADLYALVGLIKVGELKTLTRVFILSVLV